VISIFQKVLSDFFGEGFILKFSGTLLKKYGKHVVYKHKIKWVKIRKSIPAVFL